MLRFWRVQREREVTNGPSESRGETRAEGRGLTRGALLAGAGGLLLGGAAGYGAAVLADDDEVAAPAVDEQAPALPSGKSRGDYIFHGDSPWLLETRRERFGTAYLTASSLMFVRQNLDLPDERVVARQDEWTVSFEGVAEPRELTVAELKQIGVESITCVVQCSGNGRGYFEHDPSGTPWRVGAIANVMWTGVPVRAVVERLGGPSRGTRFLTATGGEELPPDVPEREAVVERSIPIEKALEDTLLAWEMNGAPVPLAHGGPLRLIVPGYWGVNNVKFVKRVAFARAESDADIMRTGYRVRPIGVEADPSQPTMWGMNVKSFVTSPAPDTRLPAGQVRVFGVAFAGENDIRRVEVSSDGGQTWNDAAFYGPSLGAAAWRRFTYAFDATPGQYTLASRATDSAGNTQPELRQENESGYAHNGWRDPAVKLVVT